MAVVVAVLGLIKTRRYANNEFAAAQVRIERGQVLEAAMRVSLEVAQAAADLQPYWKSKERLDDPQSEIAVHRHVEQAEVWSTRVRSLLDVTAHEDARDAMCLATSAELCRRALMASCLALVSRATIEECRREFLRGLDAVALSRGATLAERASEELDQWIRITDPSQEWVGLVPAKSSIYTDRLLTAARVELNNAISMYASPPVSRP